MSMTRINRRRFPCASYDKQRGAILLVLLLVFMVAGAGLVLWQLNAGQSIQNQHAQKNTVALQQAKSALLAWALSHQTTATVPTPITSAGNLIELPCPDNFSPSASDAGASTYNCYSQRLGRLPWRTLGIPPLVDAQGERLWYAVSEEFLQYGNHDPNLLNQSLPLNADNMNNNFIVYQEDGITPLASDVVAVIFAPDASLEGQLRSAESQTCKGTGGTSRPRNRCADNYLEQWKNIKNFYRLGPFVQVASASTVFNDSLIFITREELVQQAAPVLLQGAALSLSEFYHRYGHYPEPAAPNNLACLDRDVQTLCIGGSGVVSGLCLEDAAAQCLVLPITRCTGRLPQLVIEAGRPVYLIDHTLPSLKHLVAWFNYNNWESQLIYSVDSTKLDVARIDPAHLACPAPTVSTQTFSAVLWFGGIAKNTQSHANATSQSLLSNYLEDAENQDAWDADLVAAAHFVLPDARTSNDSWLGVKE